MPVSTTSSCPYCTAPISPETKFCPSCGQENPSVDQLIGQFIGGRFHVEAKLGEGGMGAVYQAEQVAMKRKVALKVLHPHLSQEEHLIERFRREAAACSRLNHPNTITIHDFGQTDDGTLFIAMEFVEGINLADLIERSGALPWPQAVHICLQVAQSLADSHEQGIVHRDLKPDNIMVIERAGQSNFVKLLDFGIAKIAEVSEGSDKRKALTKTGMIFGTPHYMSPEQIRGAGVDHRTDIYALGVILYQLVAGDLPFASENPMGMLTKHLMEPPRPLSQTCPGLQLPSQLEAMIMKCLEKDQSFRYQSMNELVRELRSMDADTHPGFAVNTPPPLASAPHALITQNSQLASGGFVGQPSSSGFVGQPSSGGFVGQPSSGGFVGQPSTTGAAPPSKGIGRIIALALLIIVLLGGTGAGAALVLREFRRDDTSEVIASPTPLPPAPPPLAPSPTPPALAPPPPAPTPGALAKTMPCTIEPLGGEKASEASKALAKAYTARDTQFALCFTPLLSKEFDGGIKVSYRWGRGSGPSKLKTSDDTVNDRQALICLKTVIQMVEHPESKRPSRARLEVKARATNGSLRSCTITAGVPARRRHRGARPPGWTPNPGSYPPYGSYGGY